MPAQVLLARLPEFLGQRRHAHQPVVCPRTPMEQLSAYRDLERNVLIGSSGRDHDELVLSANGRPYARTAVLQRRTLKRRVMASSTGASHARNTLGCRPGSPLVSLTCAR